MSAPAAFYAEKLIGLIGSTIIGVATDPENEFYALQLKAKDGERMDLWILRDDEGNGPGSFDLVESE